MDENTRNGGGDAVRLPRIIVCGGRDYFDAIRAEKVMWALYRKHGPFVLVHGDCKGADRTAEAAAEMVNAVSEDAGFDEETILIERHPADWDKHGKAAGPIRNQHMASLGAVGCVAFPGGRGTANMVETARKAGIPVWDLRGAG